MALFFMLTEWPVFFSVPRYQLEQLFGLYGTLWDCEVPYGFKRVGHRGFSGNATTPFCLSVGLAAFNKVLLKQSPQKKFYKKN